MSHVYHEGLPGFDERNVWHDGCPECEHRASQGIDALGSLDHGSRLRAWQLMRDVKWSGGKGLGPDHNVSACDLRLASTLYAVAVFMEGTGIKPDEIELRMVAENVRVAERLARYT